LEGASGTGNQEITGLGPIDFSGNQEEHTHEDLPGNTRLYSNPLYEEPTSTMASLGGVSGGLLGGQVDSGSNSLVRLILWNGQPGVEGYGTWKQGAKIVQRKVRSAAFDKKQDRHSGEEIIDISQFTVPRSDGAKAVLKLLELLEEYIRAADLGWYPPLVPLDGLLEFVRQRHPNGELAKEMLKTVLKVYYEHVHVAAVAKGWALESVAGMVTALQANTAPPTQAQDAAGSSSGNGSNQPPAGTDVTQTAMLAFLKTLTDKIASNEGKNPYLLSVKSQRYSLTTVLWSSSGLHWTWLMVWPVTRSVMSSTSCKRKGGKALRTSRSSTSGWRYCLRA
jgi:hypothetical protein